MVFKLVLFLAIPVYAYFITPEDLSLLEILDPAEQFIFGIANLGILQAFYRYFSRFETAAEKTDVASSIFWFTLLSAALWSIVFLVFAPYIVPVLLPDHPLAWLCFYLTVASLILRLVNIIPQGFLILNEQAFKQSWLQVSGGVLFVGFLSVAIIFFDRNIEAAFIGRLFLFIPLIVVGLYHVLPYIRFRFNPGLLKSMLLFSLPFVLSAAAYPILNHFDRWLLSTLIDARNTGIYGMSYRFGMIPGMLLVTPFLKAWRPFIYNYDDEETQRTVYRRVMLYYTLLGCLLWLGLSVFSEEIIRIFTAEDYYPGHVIIPYIAGSQFFYGLGWILFAGLAVKEKSLFIGVMTMAGAILNIVLNLLLIPVYGMTGAAIATLISFFVMFLGYAIYVQFNLPLNWPYARFVLMMAISLIAFFVTTLIELEPLWADLVLNAAICIVTALLLVYSTGVPIKQIISFLKSKK